MAATSVNIDIRASTTRALNEFKKFSAQLDNKFLVSGLKLDVVRSALGQINREFQRAIGEQGLASGRSLRSAQNQAVLIMDTFKNVGVESSVAITEQFSNAFSEIAIRAGGSSEDIKKALGATSWISTDLSKSVRDQLAAGVMEFQVYAKQAGLGSNYAELVQQFLAGQLTARELIDTGKPLESALGAAIARTSAAGGTIDEIVNPRQRSQIIAELQNSSQLRETLQRMIARADWGLTIIQQLNARLFNPERGVFGVLREITMAVGDKTTIFRETRELIESVFGRQGFFVTFFEQVGKIFGIDDPLKVVIKGVRWLTRQFQSLTVFLSSPPVQAVVELARKVIQGTVELFTNIYNSVREFLEGDIARQISTNITDFFAGLTNQVEAIVNSSRVDGIMANLRTGVDNLVGLFTSISETLKTADWDPNSIQDAIRQIGIDIRTFIRNIGRNTRDADVDKEGVFIKDIIITIIEEAARTIGALASEVFGTVFSSKGGAVFVAVLEGIGKVFGGLVSEGGAVGLLMSAVLGKILIGGVVKFGSAIIGALPGGQAINKMIGQRVNTALSTIPFLRPFISPESNRGTGISQTVNNARDNKFQFGVTARLDAIIRLLGNYDGPSSPLELGQPTSSTGSNSPNRRRLTARERYTRRYGQGAWDRRVRNRAANIARIRNLRTGAGGLGLGARIGQIASNLGPNIAGFSRGLGGRWTALPGWGKATALGGLGVASILGLASAGRSEELSKEQLDTLSAYEKQEIQKQQTEEKRQNTRGVLGFGASLAGGLAGGKIGGGLGFVLTGGNPIGAAVGSLLGGILGSIAGEETIKALSDPIIDGIGNLGENISKAISNAWKGAGSEISKFSSSISNWFGGALTSITSFDLGKALQTKLQEAMGTIGGAGNVVADTTNKIFSDSVRNFSATIDRFKGWLGGFIPWLRNNNDNPVTGNFAGLNFAGPALAAEARNSGHKAMIVNNQEFVIPKNGFATLTDLVETRIASSMRSKESRPTIVDNISVPFSRVISSFSDIIGRFEDGIKESKTISLNDDSNQQTNFLSQLLDFKAKNFNLNQVSPVSPELVIPKPIISSIVDLALPKNGFSEPTNSSETILASSQQGSNQNPTPISAQFNVNINVNGGLNPDNINELRGPIMTIINDAWKEATVGVASRGSIV